MKIQKLILLNVIEVFDKIILGNFDVEPRKSAYFQTDKCAIFFPR